MARALVGAVVAGLLAVSGCAQSPQAEAPKQSSPVVGLPVTTPAPTPSQVDSARTTARPTSTKPTRATTTTAKPAPGGNDVVGPFGWQTLKLGMSADAADALGMLNRTSEGGGELCAGWPALPITALERAVVSEQHGVFAIHPKPEAWIHTPEGMHVGMTTAQVHALYADFDVTKYDYPHGPTVKVPGNPKALYRMQFNASKVLVRFILESSVDVCST